MRDMYQKRKKENAAEKRYMKDILEKEICLQIVTVEDPDFAKKEIPLPDKERDVGSLINDNIVFYLCGNMLHRRRNNCADCYSTMCGAKSFPAHLNVQQLTKCKDEGHLQFVSLNMFSLISKAEASVLRVVKAKTLFLRDCFEDVLHDICLDPLATVGCRIHKVSLMTDLIFDYVVSRFKCLAIRKKTGINRKYCVEKSCKPQVGENSYIILSSENLKLCQI